jgi:predicted alpha/beta-fold hydrolase
MYKVCPSFFTGIVDMAINSMVPTLASPRSYHSYRFREVLTMPSDGERVALDWAIPNDDRDDAMKLQQPSEPNSIQRPVVIVVPDLGTDSNAGYILDAMSTFVRTGYASVAMNYRGFGGESEKCLVANFILLIIILFSFSRLYLFNFTLNEPINY